MIQQHRAIALMAAAAALALGACSMSEAPADNSMAMNDELAMSNDMAMTNSETDSVMVGGAPMMPGKTIVENASAASNLTTLVAAVKAAGLVDTLSGAGPFTVFAPTNDAFAKLPAGTVDKLVEPDMKADLTKILTYHVVPGKMTAADLKAAITKGGGKAMLTTVQGEKLTAMESGGMIVLTDAKGGTSTVTQGDVMQSNGVVHVVDSVLMP